MKCLNGHFDVDDIGLLHIFFSLSLSLSHLIFFRLLLLLFFIIVYFHAIMNIQWTKGDKSLKYVFTALVERICAHTREANFISPNRIELEPIWGKAWFIANDKMRNILQYRCCSGLCTQQIAFGTRKESPSRKEKSYRKMGWPHARNY